MSGQLQLMAIAMRDLGLQSPSFSDAAASPRCDEERGYRLKAVNPAAIIKPNPTTKTKPEAATISAALLLRCSTLSLISLFLLQSTPRAAVQLIANASPQPIIDSNRYDQDASRRNR